MISNKKRFFIVSLIICLSVLLFMPLLANAESSITEKEIEEIENKRITLQYNSANIQEVLGSLAKLANVNIVINDSINTQATADFSNITFKQALDLITKTNDLEYVWEDNIIIVDSPANIDSFFIEGEKSTELMEIGYINPRILKEEVEKIASNVEIEHLNGDLFLLKGEPVEMQDAKNYIDFLEKKSQDNNITIENIGIENTSTNIILGILNNLNPEVTIVTNSENDSLIVYGQKDDVTSAINRIKMIDNQEIAEEVDDKKQVNIIPLRYMPLDKAVNFLEETNKDIDFEIDDRKLIFKGTENQAKNIEEKLEKFEESYRESAMEFLQIEIDYIGLNQIHDILTDFMPNLNARANDHNNEILMHGTEYELKEAKNYIAQLDRPRRQVMIDIRMQEVSRNKARSLGINPDELSQIQILSSSEENPTIFDFEGVSMSLPQFLNFMEDEGVSENMANPRLMTLDGERATLQIGDKVPFTTEEIVNEKVIRNTSYRDVGISIGFEPNISSDNTVTLNVSPQIDSLGSGGSGGDPVIKTRQVDTTVRLQDKETFAIGGLIQDQTIEELSGLPYLQDIPFFGKLFQNRKINNVKSEIIIFITPYIMGNDIVTTEEYEKNPEENKGKTQAEEILKYYEENGFQTHFDEVKTELIEEINK